MNERKCYKLSLFFIYSIFVVCGLTLLITTVALHVVLRIVNIPIAVLIIPGSASIIVGSLGFFPVVKEHYYMLTIFEKILMIFLIGQTLIAIITIMVPTLADIPILYQEKVSQYWRSNKSQSLVDATQLHFQCCGANGTADYVLGLPGMNGTIPWSCCPPSDNSSLALCDLSSAYDGGCTDVIFENFETCRKLVSGVAIGTVVLGLLAHMFNTRLLYLPALAARNHPSVIEDE